MGNRINKWSQQQGVFSILLLPLCSSITRAPLPPLQDHTKMSVFTCPGGNHGKPVEAGLSVFTDFLPQILYYSKDRKRGSLKSSPPGGMPFPEHLSLSHPSIDLQTTWLQKQKLEVAFAKHFKSWDKRKLNNNSRTKVFTTTWLWSQLILELPLALWCVQGTTAVMMQDS